MCVEETHYLEMVDNEDTRFKRQMLEQLLQNHKWQPDRSTVRKNSKTGETHAVPNSRYGKEETHAQLWEQQPPYQVAFGANGKGGLKHTHKGNTKALHDAAFAYFNAVSPGLYNPDGSGTFNAVYFGYNAQCVPHRDNNDGHAVLVGLGNWTSGGRLMIEEKVSATAPATGECVCVCV